MHLLKRIHFLSSGTYRVTPSIPLLLIHLRWSGPEKLNHRSTVENSTLWQRTPFSAPMAETQLSAWSNLKFSTPWSDTYFSKPWSDLNFSTPCSDLSFSTSWSDFNWCDFLKSSNLRPSLLGMTSSTLQPHFLSGIYHDNSDCHILCVQA